MKYSVFLYNFIYIAIIYNNCFVKIIVYNKAVPDNKYFNAFGSIDYKRVMKLYIRYLLRTILL